jgi:hypothetical protein
MHGIYGCKSDEVSELLRTLWKIKSVVYTGRTFVTTVKPRSILVGWTYNSDGGQDMLPNETLEDQKGDERTGFYIDFRRITMFWGLQADESGSWLSPMGGGGWLALGMNHEVLIWKSRLLGLYECEEEPETEAVCGQGAANSAWF